MTLQARRSNRRRAPAADVPRNGSNGRAIASLARMAATDRPSVVAAALAAHVSKVLGADAALVVEYGSTPGRVTAVSAHGSLGVHPGARIPSSPVITPSADAIVSSIIDSATRAALPGVEKPRAAVSAPIPGPYAASGSITVFFARPRDFSDDDVALMEVAASLLGAALQKDAASIELAASLDIRGDNASSGRGREHAVMAGMAKAAAESPDLETGLASICEWTAEVVPYDRMVIDLVDPRSQSITRAVCLGEQLQERPAGQRFLTSADELEQLSQPASGAEEPGADLDQDESSMRAPVVWDGRLVAILWLGADSSMSYTGAALESLCRIADYLAPIIESLVNRDRSRDMAREAGESAQQLAAVLSAAPVALVAVDASGMCTIVEGRLIRDMGAISNLIKGHSLFELTGRHPQVEEIVRAALRGVPGRTLLRVGRRDLDLSTQPVLSSDGRVDGAIIVGTDVTERTAGQAALAEVKQLYMAQEERARLMSAVSHELKTPLTSIVAFIDILAANQPGNLTPEQAQALSVVQKSAERLGRLIGDLHDLARLEAGLFTLDVKTVDVDTVLQYLADTYQPLLAVRRQTLMVNNRASGWEVAADELRISQAVSNLLSNASKYSPEGSEVRLRAAVARGRLEISVVDDGPGIPESLRGRVFDAGYRVENEHTKNAPGSGLGLAIVKRIVDLHEGVVDLRDGPKGGTSASIFLPGATRRAQSAEGQADS